MSNPSLSASEEKALMALVAILKANASKQPDLSLDAWTKCSCGRLIDPKTIPVNNSGVVDYMDAICNDCRKDTKGMAKLVCVGCNSVVIALEPHREARTGYEIRMNSHVHTHKCFRCDPGNYSPVLIEKQLYYEKHGVPIHKDEDLLQEIKEKADANKEEFKTLKTTLGWDQPETKTNEIT